MGGTIYIKTIANERTREYNLRRNQSNALPYTLSVVFVVFFSKLVKASIHVCVYGHGAFVNSRKSCVCEKDLLYYV